MTENQREVVIFTLTVNKTKLRHDKALKVKQGTKV